MPKSVSLRAFAKINLGLRVLGARPDGYHDLRTVYQTIGLHDRLVLKLSRSSGVELECDDPRVPQGSANLVYRACEAWRRALGFAGGIRIRLEKRIPVGSGLGGGSSDAAAALLGLEHLTGERLDTMAKFKMAAELGSDVPAFLYGGRVLGCGRGEEVYPLPDLPRRRCLVVFPGFAVSTAEAYRELDRAKSESRRLTGNRKASRMDYFGTWSPLSLEAWEPAENDFERFVFARWPELARLKRQLIRAGAEVASLTGSGSAVYAIFSSARQLVAASREVPAGWQAFRTWTVSRREYQRRVIG